MYKTFLSFLLEGILNFKNDIKIEESNDEFGVLLTISVNKADMPILLGKKGNTILSIRNIIRVFGYKNNERDNIKIVDN